MTHRLYLNDDWLFTEQFEDSLVAPEYPENTLQPVRLPHTCKETPFHYFDESLYQMVSGYRRAPSPDSKGLAGKTDPAYF